MAPGEAAAAPWYSSSQVPQRVFEEGCATADRQRSPPERHTALSGHRVCVEHTVSLEEQDDGSVLAAYVCWLSC